MYKKPILGYVALHNKMTEKGLTIFHLAEKIKISRYKLTRMFDGEDMALTPVQTDNIKKFINEN